MAERRRFSIVYDPDVRSHLRVIEARHHSLIRTTIARQLTYEPDVQARNRKPLEQPAAIAAEWELQFGPDSRFRVFYAVDHQRREVQVLAIGVKHGNRLTIGKTEIQL
jgi:hypothetical protein